MAKKIKRLIDLTTDELMKRLFPKKVIEKAKQVAHEKDQPQPRIK